MFLDHIFAALQLAGDLLRAGDAPDARREGVIATGYLAIARRFGEITGMDQSGLLAVELFTTIVPLMVIGYAIANRFSAPALR